MVNMSSLKENLWIIPLIGAILAIISLITPIATFVVSATQTFYCWTWFILSVGQDLVLIPNSDEVLRFVGILGSVLILTAVGIIAITIYKIQNNDIKNSLVGPYWLISGFLIIGGAIISIIALNSYVLNGYTPNFGVFGQCIAAVIVMIGALLFIKDNS